jgi:hypothetical protein
MFDLKHCSELLCMAVAQKVSHLSLLILDFDFRYPQTLLVLDKN